MPIPKKYFNDRLVVLLLVVITFLTVVGMLLVLFRLDGSRSSGFFIEYRANFGVGEYKTGNALSLSSFIFYILLNMVMAVLLSMRVYNLRRHISILILSLASMLSLLAIVVSNALLGLR